jgi:hypothetical protein
MVFSLCLAVQRKKTADFGAYVRQLCAQPMIPIAEPTRRETGNREFSDFAIPTRGKVHPPATKRSWKLEIDSVTKKSGCGRNPALRCGAAKHSPSAVLQAWRGHT